MRASVIRTLALILLAAACVYVATPVDANCGRCFSRCIDACRETCNAVCAACTHDCKVVCRTAKDPIPSEP